MQKLTSEEAESALASIREKVTRALEAGKGVDIHIESGVHEWEEESQMRRKLDGSYHICIAIPADRLMSEPQTAVVAEPEEQAA